MTYSLLSLQPTAAAASHQYVIPFKVDVNSHFLPGLDDGAFTLEQSVQIARFFVKAGFTKVVATPYVMDGFYQNSTEQILEACQRVRKELKRRQIPLSVEAGAEYYVSEELLEQVKQGIPLLTFGENRRSPFVLLETGLIREPAMLEELVKILVSRNIQPVLAHPERYCYLQNSFDRILQLFRMGLLYQVDWQSFHVRQDRRVRQTVEKLVDYRMVAFAGTNLHRADEFPLLLEASRDPYFRVMASTGGILNNDLK